ncbi:undecaprenyl-phosphate glucose phosphotransferase [Salinisphaera sp. LB1]|uniref:undecaprenyl-phosphate glucose phosphotransferase n=1 Tax=Salinisphaera sp. LB1 TaxID=2183911 RepID=UPI0018F7382B|nr:undecaprenyl-phosphate glucose phosphotransferase [Salinisphaera sp. LB1]
MQSRWRIVDAWMGYWCVALCFVPAADEAISMVYRGFLREHGSVSVALYVLADVLMIVLGAYLAYAWRFGSWVLGLHYRAPVVLAVLLALTVFPAFGLYESWRGRNPLAHARAMILSWFAVVFGLVLIGFLLKQSGPYSRLWVLDWVLVSGVLLVLGRFVIHATLQALRVRGWNHRRILVVGQGSLAADVIHRVVDAPSTGWEIVATALIGRSSATDSEVIRPIRYSSRIPRLARRADIDEIWLCLPLDQQASIDQVLRDFRHSTITMRLVPNFEGIRLIQRPVTEILGLTMLNLNVSPMQGLRRVVKAVEDRVLAFLILMLISPLLLVIAIGVKLSSPGPVLFKQKRHGWGGRPTHIYKFRTMVVHEESNGVVTQASAGDQRVTAFGRFLRRTSLDELPQFINVLQGRMSIVGPRPHALVHNEEYKELIEKYMLRHSVKPGITGWAQVNGYRGKTDTVDKMRKRVECDLFYIENWSLWFDLKIIFLTIFKGFVHKNAC